MANPPELSRAYADGDLILVVGPDLSRAAKLPDGVELARRLLELAKDRALPLDRAQLEAMLERGRAAEVLSLFERRLGVEFQAEVERELSDTGVPVPALAEQIAAPRAKLRAIYTTNLDRLLERALAGEWASFGVPPADLAQRKRVLFKLRGTLEVPHSWVLTHEQQQRQLLGASLRRRAFRAAYHAHRLLFLGFEPGSELLSVLLTMLERDASDEREAPTHFIVVDGCPREEKELLESRGLELVSGPAERVLAELAEVEPPTLAPRPVVRGCPYPGLAAFTQAKRRLFFGRDAEVSLACARLGQVGDRHQRWLSIEGPTGVGKSSFVQAGILPALELGFCLGTPTRWRVAVCRPGRDPLSALLDALGGALEGPELGSSSELAASELAAELGERCSARSEGVVIVVEQLEELATQSEPGSRGRFAQVLAQLLEAEAIYLITTLRSDFVPEFQIAAPALAGSLNDVAERYALAPISRLGLREAIVEPARLAGVEAEPDLIERLVSDAESTTSPRATEPSGKALTRASTLPLVAHVLRGLWLAKAGERLTLDAYTKMGGVDGALERSADQLFHALEPEQQAAAKKLLLAMVHAAAGEIETRRSLTRAAAVSIANEDVLLALTGGHAEAGGRARLLVVEGEGSEARVDLVHEVLLRGWGRLAGWIDEDRADLELVAELERQTRLWVARDRAWTNLPHGRESGQLRRVEARGPHVADQQAFQRRLWRMAWLRRSAWTLVTGVVATAAVVVAIALAARNQTIERSRAKLEQRKVELEAREAELERSYELEQSLATMIMAESPLRRPEALNRAIELYGPYAINDRSPPAHVERCLFAATRELRLAWDWELGPSSSVALAFGGDTIVAATPTQGALVWGLDSPTPRRTLAAGPSADSSPIQAIELDHGGELALTVHADGSAILWQVTTGERLQSYTDRPRTAAKLAVARSELILADAEGQLEVWTTSADAKPSLELTRSLDTATHELHVSADGSRVVLVDDQAQVRVWTRDGETIAAPLEGFAASSGQLTISPEGRRLATVDAEWGLRLWSTQTGESYTSLDSELTRAETLAFTHGGRRLVSAGPRATPRLWDAIEGELVTTLSGHRLAVADVIVAPEADRFATVAYDAELRVWAADTGQLLTRFLAGPELPREGVLSARAEHLAVIGDAGNLRVWTLDPISEEQIVATRGQLAPNAVFARDASSVAVAEPTRVSSWSGQTGRLQYELDHRDARPRALAFTPDGTRLVTGGGHRVQIWATADGSRKAVLPKQQNSVISLAVAPDGQTLVVGDDSGDVRLWALPGLEPKDAWSAAEAEPVYDLAFSPDGRRLAVAAASHVGLYALGEPDPRATSTVDGTVSVVSFSPDGERLALAGIGFEPRCWTPETGALVEFPTDDTLVAALAFSDDGERLVTGGDAGVVVWDANTGARLDELDRGRAAPLALELSPQDDPRSSPWLLIARSDGSIARTSLSVDDRLSLACAALRGRRDFDRAVAIVCREATSD